MEYKDNIERTINTADHARGIDGTVDSLLKVEAYAKTHTSCEQCGSRIGVQIQRRTGKPMKAICKTCSRKQAEQRARILRKIGQA